MNRPARSPSTTEATLNARTELRRLRMLVGVHTVAADELDRLEVVLSDALHLTEEQALTACEERFLEKYVHIDEFHDLKEELERSEEENETLKKDRDEARERLEELLEAASENPDKVLSRLTEALSQIDRLKARLQTVETGNGRLEARLRAVETENAFMASHVKAALQKVHPGSRSKAKLEQYDVTAAAIRAALDGKP